VERQIFLNLMKEESLNNTWFIDIDGTIVKHLSNDTLDVAIEKKGDESYLLETPISKSVHFLNSIPPNDTIVLTTARDSKHKEHTLKMLKYYNIKYDRILFDLRSGPRYLINDTKPIGVVGNKKPIQTAFAINVERDKGIKV
tara:strand:- start:319 stop:744 length:426 start_codon:yes stop_codon:yes gene_type:complete